ncbi:hypothetical protein ACFL4Q_02775 [candidate division KSB1 bacterium]
MNELNDSESLVYHICNNTFFKLWTFPQPQGKANNKELCDILVLFDEDILIFSVKDCEFKDSYRHNVENNIKRWQRKSIDNSCKQIYGAERWLNESDYIILSDGSRGPNLPPKSTRRIHRVAIAFGGKNKVPMYYGDFGRGFIHVFNEVSFLTILNELDTITDFTDYLKEKESFYGRGINTPFLCGEENLLAIYLFKNRKLPTNAENILIDNSSWEDICKKPEYIKKKKEDKLSYKWDWLIDYLSGSTELDKSKFKFTDSDLEKILRMMAKETRFMRRTLSKSLKEFLNLAKQFKIRSRFTESHSGIGYVFMYCKHNEDRESRLKELQMRCFIAMGELSVCKNIVGINFVEYSKKTGSYIETCLLRSNKWSMLVQRVAKKLKDEMGFFQSPIVHEQQEDEYPNIK